MAKSKAFSFIARIAEWFVNLGRKVGARRALFVWSAISFAMALMVVWTVAPDSYVVNGFWNINGFIISQIKTLLLIFLEVFTPMFMLIVAAKYIFDRVNIKANGMSRTLKISFAAAAFVGIAAATLNYLDAGNFIGAGTGSYCAAARCFFNLKMLLLAGEVFMLYGVGTLLLLLALRGIYTELSYMLAKNN